METTRTHHAHGRLPGEGRSARRGQGGVDPRRGQGRHRPVGQGPRGDRAAGPVHPLRARVRVGVAVDLRGGTGGAPPRGAASRGKTARSPPGGRGVTEKNMVEALNMALHQAMSSDERVVVMGEDVARTGGVFRVTAGLLESFGEDRVVDTPLAESGIIGTAIGMSVYG